MGIFLGCGVLVIAWLQQRDLGGFVHGVRMGTPLSSLFPCWAGIFPEKVDLVGFSPLNPKLPKLPSPLQHRPSPTQDFAVPLSASCRLGLLQV